MALPTTARPRTQHGKMGSSGAVVHVVAEEPNAARVVAEELGSASSPVALTSKERSRVAKIVQNLVDGVGTPSPPAGHATRRSSPSTASSAGSVMLGPTQEMPARTPRATVRFSCTEAPSPMDGTQLGPSPGGTQLVYEETQPARPLSPESDRSPMVWSANVECRSRSHRSGRVYQSPGLHRVQVQAKPRARRLLRNKRRGRRRRRIRSRSRVSLPPYLPPPLDPAAPLRTSCPRLPRMAPTAQRPVAAKAASRAGEKLGFGF